MGSYIDTFPVYIHLDAFQAHLSHKRGDYLYLSGLVKTWSNHVREKGDKLPQNTMSIFYRKKSAPVYLSPGLRQSSTHLLHFLAKHKTAPHWNIFFFLQVSQNPLGG